MDLPAIDGFKELAINYMFASRRVRHVWGKVVTCGNIGNRVAAGVVACEGELARLLEEIIHVDLRNLAVIANVDIVPTHQPMHIVGQRVVGPVEERLRIAADIEEARDLDLIDLLEARLPDVTPRSATSTLFEIGPRESRSN